MDAHLDGDPLQQAAAGMTNVTFALPPLANHVFKEGTRTPAEVARQRLQRSRHAAGPREPDDRPRPAAGPLRPTGRSSRGQVMIVAGTGDAERRELILFSPSDATAPGMRAGRHVRSVGR